MRRTVGLSLLLLLTLFSSFTYCVSAHVSQPVADTGGKNCERIRVPLCLDTPYNFTRMPNILGHSDQQSAAITIDEYKALVDAQCSNNLKFFLCSMFTPMCTDAVDIAITSCRSVCEEVKKNCLPLLSNFGLPWPETLNCTQFPVKGRGTLCMDPYPPSHEPSATDSRISNNNNNKNSASGDVRQSSPGTVNSKSSDCGPDFVPTDFNEARCSLKCDRDWMFSKENKQFAEVWMFSWSFLCFLVTLFTVITFCLDRARFPYPERPIIFLSFCYNLYSFGYLLRYFLKADVVKCQTVKTTVSSSLSSSSNMVVDNNERSVLISGDLDNSSCVIVFMILYYFANACAIWWVILSFTWFLAAIFRWSKEGIANYSQFFHLIAWGTPAVMTVAVMITKSVDAGELTGLCYVGQQSSVALLGYVIAPWTFFLIIGIGFTGAGLFAMVGIRKQLRKEMRPQEREENVLKVEKLMVRVGIFALLYSLPAIVVIVCYIYEYRYLELWTLRDHCKHPRTDVEVCREWSLPRPRVEIYMLKIFMSLVVGVTCGMWVLSKKTFATWRKLLTCGLLKGPGPKYVAYQPTVGRQTTTTPAVAVPLMSLNLHNSGSSGTRYGFQPTITASEVSATR